jgi:hypothetical protein
LTKHENRTDKQLSQKDSPASTGKTQKKGEDADNTQNNQF